jgi:glucose-6-phosphate 1-dehydrogenase
MAGNAALLTREDAVEAIWKVVDAVLMRPLGRIPTSAKTPRAG